MQELIREKSLKLEIVPVVGVFRFIKSPVAIGFSLQFPGWPSFPEKSFASN